MKRSAMRQSLRCHSASLRLSLKGGNQQTPILALRDRQQLWLQLPHDNQRIVKWHHSCFRETPDVVRSGRARSTLRVRC